eukprot:jgi/Phyca11/509147/fgenesh2_kg.PHYCAscaffold_42_\
MFKETRANPPSEAGIALMVISELVRSDARELWEARQTSSSRQEETIEAQFRQLS